MRKMILIAALAVLGSNASPEPASAETWCIKDFGSTHRTCVFPELRDCVRAAQVAGGVCERDTAVDNRRSSGTEGKRSRRQQDWEWR